MDVVVDTNVLVQHARLDGQKVRALFDYLNRTRSRLVVPEVVEQELRAVLERQWTSAATELESAAKRARRIALDAPHIDASAIVSASLARWEEAYANTSRLRATFKLNPDLLPEVLRRATLRIAPCARRGEEFRDALLWLGLIEKYGKSGEEHVAFISENRKDFCSPEGKTLAPQLIADADSAGITVHYYASLDDFIRDHAKKIEHLTIDWVRERISLEEIQDKIEAHLEDADPEDFELESSLDWRPRGSPRIRYVIADLDDVYVWQYSDAEIFLFVGFHARVAAIIACELEEDGVFWSSTREDDIDAYASFKVEISVAISDHDIELIDIETLKVVKPQG